MRLQCTFYACPCQKHRGHPDGRCLQCGHGGCWHTLDQMQFYSVRQPARTPKYVAGVCIFVPIMPTVQPLPDEPENFCEAVIGLPV